MNVEDTSIESLVAVAKAKILEQPIASEPADEIQQSDQFSTYLVWKNKEPLLPGRSYVFSQTNAQTSCSVSALNIGLTRRMANISPLIPFACTKSVIVI